MVRRRKPTRQQPRPCTVVQLVSVGLDLNRPVGTSLARVDCDLTKDSTSAAAAWLTAAGSGSAATGLHGSSRRCSSRVSPAPSVRPDRRGTPHATRMLVTLASFVIYRINSPILFT